MKKTDLQCALSKILANLLKNNTVHYKDKKINMQYVLIRKEKVL